MNDLLIKNATVLAMGQDSQVMEGYDLVIDEGMIVELVPGGSASDAQETIDATDLYLLPGLINAHTHVGMSYFKGTGAGMPLFKWLEWGWFYIERMSEEDIYWAAKLACMEMIRAGITTFNDMYFSERKTAQAAAETGLRACLTESIMEPAGGMDMKNSIDQQFDVTRSFFDEWHGAENGRISVFVGPHSPYACSAEILERTAELAAEKDSRLHIHLSETETEVEEAYEKWGMSPAAYLDSLGLLDCPITAAHCVHLSDEDIDLVDRPSFGVSHNPAANLKLQSGIAPVSKMVDRNLAVGLGSDGNGSNDVIDILKESYLATILHPWEEDQRPAQTALSMATREGARALGLKGTVGTLEAGMRADLILLSLEKSRTTPVHKAHDTIALTAHGSDVVTTIVDGKILMRDQEFLTLNSEEVLAQAQERSDRIFGVPSPVKDQ